MCQVGITKNRLLRQFSVTVIPTFSATPVPCVSEVSARLEIFDGFVGGVIDEVVKRVWRPRGIRMYVYLLKDIETCNIRGIALLVLRFLVGASCNI